MTFCIHDRPYYVGGPNSSIPRPLPDLMKRGVEVNVLSLMFGDPTRPPTMRQLRKAGAISRGALSVSDDAPGNIVGGLEVPGHEVLVSKHDGPQHRLFEIRNKRDADHAVEFTSYTVLPDADRLAQATEAIAVERADLVSARNAISSKFIIAVSRRGAELWPSGWIGVSDSHGRNNDRRKSGQACPDGIARSRLVCGR